MIAPYMHHLAASRKQTCAQGGGPGPGEFWVPVLQEVADQIDLSHYFYLNGGKFRRWYKSKDFQGK